MSLVDLGKNDISEETQALKDKVASRDTECAGLRTRLMRREAELEELQATLNETVYKLSKEAERALQLEQEASTRSSELKTERMSLRNTELALQSAQDRLKAEERAKRELESTLDTVSLHSQTTNAEHQAVQRDKRALESRVRELERIVQTHEARRVSNIPHKSGRPRSSSVSNFRLPAVEQELNDTKAQLHTKEMSLRVLEQKLAQAQEDLVKAENARISTDKAGQKRVSELLSTLERKEEELDALRETDHAGEREEELLKRIDEDAAKITALERLAAESQATRPSQARIQKLQAQLKAESEKLQRSEDLQSRLLHEKEELVRQYKASQREIHEGHELLMSRECQITELETKHAHLLTLLDAHDRCQKPLLFDAECSSHQFQRLNGMQAFPNESALADHIQTLLQAIDRLRDERDELKRALEFSEVEYRITTEGFQTQITSLTRQLTGSMHVTSVDKSPVDAHVRQRTNRLTSCATALCVVVSNLQARLDLSEDRLSSTAADLVSSNSQLRDALTVIDGQKQSLDMDAHEHDALLRQVDATTKELSESMEECGRLGLQLTAAEGQIAAMVECAKTSEAAREEDRQGFLLAEERLAVLYKSCQDVESERNSLALQITNLQDDLARVQDELVDTHNRYDTLRAQQLSAMSASEVVQALRDRIQELEARIVYHTNQIGDYQHDIRRLEANVKLHEERIGEMASELELLASQKEAMVEDCAEAREARDEARERLEAAEEETEKLQQQLQQVVHAHGAELSVMSSVAENLTSENQQTAARLADVQAENVGLIHELDSLRCEYQCLHGQLDTAVPRSRSLETEISENAQTQQAIISFAVIHRAYKGSSRQLQRYRQHITFLESQLAFLNQDLEQKVALLDSGEKERHKLLQRLSDVFDAVDKTQDETPTIADLHAESQQDDDEVNLLRNAVQEKEQELATMKQMLEETKCCRSTVEADLLERIAMMTVELQAQAGLAEDIADLRAEAEDARAQLQNSLQNFADLEKLHGDVIQEFVAAKEVFERQLSETDEQIRALDADHQQSLSAMEAKHKHDTSILTGNLEDGRHEIDGLRQELQDISEAQALNEGKHHEELRSYEVRCAVASDLEKGLRQTIADMRQRLTRAEAETVVLQEGRQSLQMEITSLQAEIQRSTSLTRYLESQVRESEEACVLLKEGLQKLQLSLAESEKAGKAAEFNLTLQATQHEKVVAAFRREIASLQSGPDLRSAFADLEEKNREMDDLLRVKCQEIEEYDDRILETLKANKKLTSKVESLTRKVQALQGRLALVKNQPQEPVTENTPPEKAPSAPSPPASALTTTHAGSYANSVHIRENAASSLTVKSKTPEPRPQSVVALPSLQTPGKTSELSEREMSAGKKRPAPDDDERDSVPAEGHYSADACLRNGPTPRLRRVHGHPGGFTPVRGASSRKHTAVSSPGRRVTVTPSDVITDVTNSPRAPSRQGDSQPKKKSWLGKIRGGAGPQPMSSRLGAFGGQ